MKLDPNGQGSSRPGSGHLPKGWAWACVEEIGADDEQAVLTGPFGTNLGRDEFQPSGVPVLTIGCLTSSGVSLDKAMYVSEAKARELKKYRLRDGDLLFSRMATVGRAGIVPSTLGDALFNYHMMRLRLRSNLMHARFFLYYVRGADAVRKHLEAVAHGATRAGINTRELLRMPVQVAPFGEQTRIVDAIETQLTRLDAAVAALERVRANLKRYRASVLKAAVEGRLVPTEAELARQEGRDYEPAAVLLQHILAERRRRWEEAELAAMKAKGKTPKDEKWKAKYEEPVAPDTAGLPELPEGWCWASISALLTEPLRNGHSAKPDASGDVPIITLTAVTEGNFSDQNLKLTRTPHSKAAQLWLRAGDLLIERSNTPELVGTARLFPGPDNLAIFPDLVIRVRLSAQIAPAYAEAYLQGPAGRDYYRRSAQGIAGSMPKISQGVIEATLIPLPPMAEQRRITDCLSDVSSVIAVIEEQSLQSEMRCDRLRQSILKWAFEGKLVDQDPNDEPASVLLERIRAERTAAAAKTNQTGRTLARRPKSKSARGAAAC